MSSTRYADDDAPPRQEAYASSGAHESNLAGNLVALRCKAAMRPEHRSLCYFIQQLSHRDGGLKRIVSEIIAAFPERLLSGGMKRLGIMPGRTLTEEQCEALQRDFPRYRAAADAWWLLEGNGECPEDNFPRTSDPLFANCRNAAEEHMEEALRAACLDPRADLNAVPFCYHIPRRRENERAVTWYVDDFVGTLELLRKRHIAAARGTIAETEITRLVHDGIKRATFAKGLAIIEGIQRSGKTTAAKNFCDTHPGECVFIELESGDDDTTFFRSLARSIGTASSNQYTTLKIRGRIEDMLQAGHLTVVIDESHFLAPIKARPTAPPKRLDWVRRSLLDKGVPVVFLSTPQFDRQCAHYETHLSWNADQLKGRIVWQKVLPTTLSAEEVKAVARKIVPEAPESMIVHLAAHAIDSQQYLFGIKRVVENARYFASTEGRDVPTRDDLKRALGEIAPLPASNSATVAKPRCKGPAKPAHGRSQTLSAEVPPALARRAGLNLSTTTAADDGEIEHPRFTEAASPA